MALQGGGVLPKGEVGFDGVAHVGGGIGDEGLFQ